MPDVRGLTISQLQLFYDGLAPEILKSLKGKQQ